MILINEKCTRKEEFKKGIALNENIIEAIPSAMILNIIRVQTGNFIQQIFVYQPFVLFFLVPGSSLHSAIDPDSYFFKLSYTSSLISSALGLAHILKNGVGRVLGNGGGCDGLCAGQFILVFFACFFGKDLWLNWIISIFLRGYLN